MHLICRVYFPFGDSGAFRMPLGSVARLRFTCGFVASVPNGDGAVPGHVAAGSGGLVPAIYPRASIGRWCGRSSRCSALSAFTSRFRTRSPNARQRSASSAPWPPASLRTSAQRTVTECHRLVDLDVAYHLVPTYRKPSEAIRMQRMSRTVGMLTCVLLYVRRGSCGPPVARNLAESILHVHERTPAEQVRYDGAVPTDRLAHRIAPSVAAADASAISSCRRSAHRVQMYSGSDADGRCAGHHEFNFAVAAQTRFSEIPSQPCAPAS